MEGDRENQEFVEGNPSGDEEAPEIYSVHREGKNYKFKRRNFLIKAAAVSAAALLVGTGIDSVNRTQTDASISDAVPDETRAVKLNVSLLGMSIVPVGASFVRTWQLKNTGETWCEAAILHLFEKDSPEAAKVIPIPAIEPGQTVEIPVELTAPEVPGSYLFNWRLQLQKGMGNLKEFAVSVLQTVLAETAHPYENNMDSFWTLNNPDTGAAFSRVHFTRVETEMNYDYLEVQDGSSSVIQTITGNYPSGLTSDAVPGSIVKLHFVSDYSLTYWGFAADSIVTSAQPDNFVFLPIIMRPAPTPTSYVVCSCNTVDVCTCNLVCTCDTICTCDGVCSCVGYCSCNTVCTCDTVCTCQDNHYWYPN